MSVISGVEKMNETEFVLPEEVRKSVAPKVISKEGAIAVHMFHLIRSDIYYKYP